MCLCVACDCDAALSSLREELYEEVLASQMLKDFIDAEVARKVAAQNEDSRSITASD